MQKKKYMYVCVCFSLSLAQLLVKQQGRLGSLTLVGSQSRRKTTRNSQTREGCLETLWHTVYQGNKNSFKQFTLNSNNKACLILLYSDNFPMSCCLSEADLQINFPKFRFHSISVIVLSTILVIIKD